MSTLDRRSFLRAGLATSFMAGSGALGHLASQQAFAAGTTGYKALVAVFLHGGMDAWDTVIPYDAPSHALLRSNRESIFSSYASTGNSREQSGLLEIIANNQSAFGSRRFAFPPELSEMKSIFDAGELAIVGNIGPLVEPIDRASLASGAARAPKHLFSHNDQQAAWMTLASEGERMGWGGKMSDVISRSDTSLDRRFISVTSGTNNVFLSGEVASPFSTVSNGAPILEIVERPYLLGTSSVYDPVRRNVEDFLEKASHENEGILEQDFSAFRSSGILGNKQYNRALSVSPSVTTPFPETRLGQQLEAVAQTINLRSSLGTKRQIFFVSMGGFDTHSNQTRSLPALHTQISKAISAFRTAMIGIGAWNDVTLFTMSDFGRTLIENGNGTDHGWGGHHFVTGGSVKGKSIYGDIPTPDLTNPVFTEKRGRLIPTTSVEQYAATLAQWFGLSSSEVSSILPNLNNFSNRTLGFL